MLLAHYIGYEESLRFALDVLHNRPPAGRSNKMDKTEFESLDGWRMQPPLVWPRLQQAPHSTSSRTNGFGIWLVSIG